MRNVKKIFTGVLTLCLISVLNFNTFASYGDLLKGYGDIFGSMGQALEKADKGDTAGALKDYFGALGSLAEKTEELTKTTVLQDVQAYEEKMDEFIKYLDTIEDKMKEQKTSDEDKQKIAKIIARILNKLKSLTE